MATKKQIVFKVGRDAGTGRFMTPTEAQRNAKTAVVETIKRPTQPKRK